MSNEDSCGFGSMVGLLLREVTRKNSPCCSMDCTMIRNTCLGCCLWPCSAFFATIMDKISLPEAPLSVDPIDFDEVGMVKPVSSRRRLRHDEGKIVS